jgi:hypothetical protein
MYYGFVTLRKQTFTGSSNTISESNSVIVADNRIMCLKLAAERGVIMFFMEITEEEYIELSKM